MSFNEVILVDEQDNAVGKMEKMEAHQKGLLHRAFSVFIFNNEGKMLLQKRASHKYHSPGLWTNTCCSHPAPSEITLDAATRRLKEEMGFICSLQESGSFLYKAEFDNGLTEHEFDHLFTGVFNDTFKVNPEEVADYQWLSLQQIEDQIRISPESFTVWFKIAYPIIRAKIQQN